MPTVLIASFANWEGISRMPFLLSRARCRVEVLSPGHTFIAHSSYVDQHRLAPDDLDEFLEVLKAHLEQTQLTQREGRYDWIVVADDLLLYALGKRRQEPWARQLLPCRADDQAIDFLVSKLDFLTQADARGLRVPPYVVCQNKADLQAAAQTLGFPLVVKEREGFGGKAVRIVPNPAALAALEVTEALIAQAFIIGPVCSAAAYFDHGRLVGYYAYFRERTWGPTGASTAIRFHVFAEVQDLLQKLGDLSGFHGLCGIDFIQQAGTDKIFLLEQNFRPTLTMLLGVRVGVDVSDLIRRTLSREVIAPPCQQTVPLSPDPIPIFPIDLLRAVEEKDTQGLLRWLFTPRWWPELNAHDRRLLRYNLGYVLKYWSAKLTRYLGRARGVGADAGA